MYTLRQAAAYLGVSYNTIRNACLDGRLKYLRIGRRIGRGTYRIAPADLEAFVASCAMEIRTAGSAGDAALRQPDGSIRLPRQHQSA